MPARNRTKSLLLFAAGVLWVIGLAFGLRASLNYESAPGAPGQPPADWPAESKIQRGVGVPTLVIMAHPHCPCTRATLGELAVLMARVHKRVTAVVVFVVSNGVPEKWEETDLWRDAGQIPGVRVLKDPGGKEAALFGALASGQTMFFDAGGKLQFSGGITASRGHSGDNAGRSTITALLLGGKSEIKTTPVFGCYLGNPETRARNGS
jgi:hypothetical protein